MYNVVWDEETGGILLTEKEVEGPSPELRPVFYEELKLLGLDQYWNIPFTEAPLLWATPGKIYYYRGRKVAEVSGGSFFREPKVQVCERDLALYPINVTEMLRKNESFLLNLTHQALDFIAHTFKRYRSKAGISCVSFSGGKDSWVLLDLAQRVLAPQDFVVVFSDTGMEISPTYESVERARACFQKLRFYTARSPLAAEESWRLFGPPSRIQRWCCAVHKSVPAFLLLRRLTAERSSKVLVFEGVRALESSRRATYPQITEGAKHGLQVNASPIFSWSAAEVFLYLFWRGLFLHRGYRLGLNRVGCAVCPLASNWTSFVHWRVFSEDCRPFLEILRAYALSTGRKDEDEIREFIASQAWGARAGGWFLKQAALVQVENTKGFSLSLPQDREEALKAWLQVAGRLWRLNEKTIRFEREGEAVFLEVKRTGRKILLKSRREPSARLKGLLRVAAYKAGLCVGCRACEAECPTGALSFAEKGDLRWEEERCLRCLACFTFEERGCLMAKSLQKTSGVKMAKIATYQTFGLRKEWLKEFLEKGEDFWGDNSLGNRQEEALRAWLRDAGLLEQKKLTPLGRFLKSRGVEDPLTWEIIWVRLAQGSRLVRWFLAHVAWGERLSQKELVERLGDEIAKRTRQNAVSALLGLFEHTPLKGICPVERVKRERVLTKKGTEEITPWGLLFALYTFAERAERYHFLLEDLMQPVPETPYGLFGLSRERLAALLRAASSQAEDLLKVDILRDLESVYLREGLPAEQILYERSIGIQ